MKTVLAYAFGFSVTFTVIAGGMYVLSKKYPWMFGTSNAQEKAGETTKLAAGTPSDIGGVVGASAASDSSSGDSEIIGTLKTMLAAKNDSISAKDQTILHLDSVVTKLHRENSDANNVIARLQNQVNSWTSEQRKELASTYNDMSPTSAAKIMKNLDDKNIIFILSNVQKKQAAQILGQLDPVRVAKLLTSLGHNK